jgi:hypothetical protein
MSEGKIKDWMDHDECGRLREAIQKIRKVLSFLADWGRCYNGQNNSETIG